MQISLLFFKVIVWAAVESIIENEVEKVKKHHFIYIGCNFEFTRRSKVK